jgi:hypothetical protein
MTNLLSRAQSRWADRRARVRRVDDALAALDQRFPTQRSLHHPTGEPTPAQVERLLVLVREADGARDGMIG